MREKAVKNSVCVDACVAGCTPSILGRMGREVISEAGGCTRKEGQSSPLPVFIQLEQLFHF